MSDRIRENLRKYKRMELNELLNLSINETLSRTILTGVTAIAVHSGALFLRRRGDAQFQLRHAASACLIGTYSSIFIAAPLLGYLGVKRDTVEGRSPGKANTPAAGKA